MGVKQKLRKAWEKGNVPGSRFFGGDKYELYRWASTKAEVQKITQQLKGQGSRYRVTYYDNVAEYAIWVRPLPVFWRRKRGKKG